MIYIILRVLADKNHRSDQDEKWRILDAKNLETAPNNLLDGLKFPYPECTQVYPTALRPGI